LIKSLVPSQEAYTLFHDPSLDANPIKLRQIGSESASYHQRTQVRSKWGNALAEWRGLSIGGVGVHVHGTVVLCTEYAAPLFSNQQRPGLSPSPNLSSPCPSAVPSPSLYYFSPWVTTLPAILPISPLPSLLHKRLPAFVHSFLLSSSIALICSLALRSVDSKLPPSHS
jgi:hypothetical protein